MKTVKLNSRYKSEMIDITELVQEEVMKLGLREGLCTIFVPHTTASIVLFIKGDSKLRRDFLSSLNNIAPNDGEYESDDPNAAAHIKSTICGPRIVVPVQNGRLFLGEWQGIFFCEFDGPREREFHIQVI
ncbi:MAG: YjbQ family protein [Epsilonproteobacteria bacterium]|nr:YjbQ family protein [Campylobacterota bacterium]